jgi:hypothetical protein
MASAKKGTMAIETGPPGPESLDQLLAALEDIDLQDIDPSLLREAEFEQTRWVLDELAGKTIAKAELEDTRIVIETGDGNRYFFYGFMGSGRPNG